MLVPFFFPELNRREAPVAEIPVLLVHYAVTFLPPYQAQATAFAMNATEASLGVVN
jgi:hypothetical protein